MQEHHNPGDHAEISVPFDAVEFYNLFRLLLRNVEKVAEQGIKRTVLYHRLTYWDARGQCNNLLDRLGWDRWNQIKSPNLDATPWESIAKAL